MQRDRFIAMLGVGDYSPGKIDDQGSHPSLILRKRDGSPLAAASTHFDRKCMSFASSDCAQMTAAVTRRAPRS